MNIILLIITLIFSIYLYWKTNNKFNPISLFSLIWIIQIILSLCLYNIFIIKLNGLIFINLCIISSLLGYNVITHKNENTIFTKIHRYSNNDINKNLLFYILLLSVTCSIIYIILDLLSKGYTFSNLINFNDLLRMNNQITLDRYYYKQFAPNSTLQNILLVFLYLSPLLGGFIFCLLKKWQKLVSFIVFFPNLFVTLTHSEKMPTISAVILWISGFIVSCWLFNIHLKITLKRIFTIIGLCCVFILILYISMIFRIGKFDFSLLLSFSDKFVTYSFGHLSVFTTWFDCADFSNIKHTYGLKLFYGISNFIGILDRQDGLYQENFFINYNGDHSNIYTIFRLLIEDFGIIGCQFFFFILGIFSKLILICIRIQKFEYISSSILVAIYNLIFWSFVTTFWAYTSYIIMYVFFVICLFISFKTKYNNKNSLKTNKLII